MSDSTSPPRRNHFPLRRFAPGRGYSINREDQKLNHDADGEARAGIVRVVHVIASVDVIDVDVIGVIPA